MVLPLRPSTLARVALAVALSATRTPSLVAQATTVTLQGTITGNGGGAVLSAHLEVWSRETGATRGALADPDGASFTRAGFRFDSTAHDSRSEGPPAPRPS